MRIAAIGYREWALKIYDRLSENKRHSFLIIRSREEYSIKKVKDFNPDLTLYYGWSWKISSEIFLAFPSIMLHPSPLPLYRGGSPIQNQIINGVRDSAVTLFLISEEMDAGDIIAQDTLSLSGRVADIFERMTEIGYRLTLDVIENGYTARPQDHQKASYYKRRNPQDSEITLDEFSNESSTYLYNKIRMLEDPYPNAFIRCADGKKLILKHAAIE